MPKTTRTTGPSGPVTGSPVGPANSIAGVVVVTGNERRPDDIQTVIWVGGSTEPVNKSDQDLWFPGAASSGGNVLLPAGSTLELANSAQRLLRVNIPDDGTATAGWPDRLAFYFEEEDGSFVRTGYFNEYGEVRARAAKDNTVALRVMAHEENVTDTIFEIADADQTETYFEVSKVAADFFVELTAPNLPIDKIKTSNLTVNNTTTPQSDPTLVADLNEAGATYVIEGVIQYEATQAADMRMRFNFSNDPTTLAVWSPVLQSGATSATNSVNIGARTANTNFTAGGIGAGSPITMGFTGTVVTNLATTLTLQFAQASAEVSDVIVYAGSRLTYRRVM